MNNLHDRLVLPRLLFAPEDGAGGAGSGGAAGDAGGGAAGAGGGKPDTGSDAGDDTTDWKAEAEKWKGLSRKHEGNAKANADAATRLKELEDKDKSESQKIADELTAARAEGSMSKAELLRVEVALDKAPDGMSAKDVARYAKRLHGSTREELEADAEEFFKDFNVGDTSGGKRTAPATRPKEKLHAGGSGNDDATEMSVSDIVKHVPRL